MRPTVEPPRDPRPEPPRDPVRVWFYGDYGCPFSYLADRRLELLGRERRLDVRWRPLGRSPDTTPCRGAGLGIEPRGSGPSGPAAGEPLEQELRRAAADLGLPLRLPVPSVDTTPALQAAEFARDLGGPHFARLHRTLFRALLAEGLDLGSRSVLLRVAEEADLDPEALGHALDDGRYAPELEEARAEAERYGITGTPGLLFGRFLLIGAASLDELRRVAERAELETDGR